MRRTVRLTERDLTRLVKRIVEQEIVEAVRVIPLSKVNDSSRIGPKGTYYVDRNGGLVIDDGNGDTLVLSDAEYDKNKEN